MERLLRTPISNSNRLSLIVGDEVYITGVIYTARDAAHKNLVESLKKSEVLPFDLKDQVVYYVGPTPAKPGQAIGSCGPTSSYRMDKFSPILMAEGLKVMIGKGERSTKLIKEIKKHQAVYLMTVGGIGALLSKTVKKSEVIAYPELGAEAIRRLEVENFPAIVAIDSKGNSLYTATRCLSICFHFIFTSLFSTPHHFNITLFLRNYLLEFFIVSCSSCIIQYIH